MFYGGSSAGGASKMTDAMVNAIRAQVFSSPILSLRHPSMGQQGAQGQRGAYGGQTQVHWRERAADRAEPKTTTAQQSRPQQPAATPGAPAGGNAPQMGGLGAIAPLLGFDHPS